MPLALVTGASAGIGRACALALAEDGFDLALTYRAREAEAAALAAQVRALGRDVQLARVDFLEPIAAVEAAVATLLDGAGPPQVLVNNAGVSPRAAFLEESSADVERTLRVNLLVPLALARLVAQRMIPRGGGAIVNVTSVLAQLPLEQCGAYCASKAALELHTRVQALELVAHGIRVNAVAPGHTATPMNYGDEAEAATAKAWEAIPLRRTAHPREIAEAVRFLASERASYVTGATLLVDGGLSLPNGPAALQAEMGLPPDPAAFAPAR